MITVRLNTLYYSKYFHRYQPICFHRRHVATFCRRWTTRTWIQRKTHRNFQYMLPIIKKNTSIFIKQKGTNVQAIRTTKNVFQMLSCKSYFITLSFYESLICYTCRLQSTQKICHQLLLYNARCHFLALYLII